MYILKDETIENIANAIRNKTGSEELIKPSEMDEKINTISVEGHLNNCIIDDENNTHTYGILTKDGEYYAQGSLNEDGDIVESIIKDISTENNPEEIQFVVNIAKNQFISNGNELCLADYYQSSLFDYVDKTEDIILYKEDGKKVKILSTLFLDHLVESVILGHEGNGTGRAVKTAGVLNNNGEAYDYGIVDKNGDYYNTGIIDASGNIVNNNNYIMINGIEKDINDIIVKDKSSKIENLKLISNIDINLVSDDCNFVKTNSFSFLGDEKYLYEENIPILYTAEGQKVKVNSDIFLDHIGGGIILGSDSNGRAKSSKGILDKYSSIYNSGVLDKEGNYYSSAYINNSGEVENNVILIEDKGATKINAPLAVTPTYNENGATYKVTRFEFNEGSGNVYTDDAYDIIWNLVESNRDKLGNLIIVEKLLQRICNATNASDISPVFNELLLTALVNNELNFNYSNKTKEEIKQELISIIEQI